MQILYQKKKPENKYIDNMPPEVFRKKRLMSTMYFQMAGKIRWINR